MASPMTSKKPSPGGLVVHRDVPVSPVDRGSVHRLRCRIPCVRRTAPRMRAVERGDPHLAGGRVARQCAGRYDGGIERHVAVLVRNADVRAREVGELARRELPLRARSKVARVDLLSRLEARLVHVTTRVDQPRPVERERVLRRKPGHLGRLGVRPIGGDLVDVAGVAASAEEVVDRAAVMREAVVEDRRGAAHVVHRPVGREHAARHRPPPVRSQAARSPLPSPSLSVQVR